MTDNYVLKSLPLKDGVNFDIRLKFKVVRKAITEAKSLTELSPLLLSVCATSQENWHLLALSLDFLSPVFCQLQLPFNLKIAVA